VINQGDLVRVRQEEELSVVVLPTDRRADCLPEGVPEVYVCCVPIALVRTPVDDENGAKRWVEIRDLTRVGPEEIATDLDGPARPILRPGAVRALLPPS
jgi:hypothetical protein